MTPLERRVLGASELAPFRDWLDNCTSRTSPAQHTVPQGLPEIKSAAVGADDQELASACWCIEQVISAQYYFISGFSKCIHRAFYGGWCDLEKSEIALLGLNRHYSSPEGRFGVPRMRDTIPKIQALYPYRFFGSPGYIVHEAACSICGAPWRIRDGCGHRRFGLYDGKMCGRDITRCEMLEVSLVENPVQKYSVMFPQGIPFNYALVDYAVRGMVTPWTRLEYAVVERRRPSDLASDARFSSAGRNEPCPCGSSKKFKKCCLKEMTETYPHHQFEFERDPRLAGLNSYTERAVVYGTDDAQGGASPPKGLDHSNSRDGSAAQQHIEADGASPRSLM